MSEFDKIVARAARLCSGAEKCSHDIRTKMVGWGLDEEEAGKAIDYLIENKFLDDRRFAASFARDKFRFNKWGRIRIAYALREKKIPGAVIEASLESIDPEEYRSVLTGLLEDKIRSIGSISKASDKAKVVRFAAQKGFSSDEIFKALDQIKDPT